MLFNLIIDQINWKEVSALVILTCDINLYKFVISFFQKNGRYHPCHSEHWEKCRFLGIRDFWDKCRIRDLCSDLLRNSVHYASIPIKMGQLEIWARFIPLPPFWSSLIISDKIFGDCQLRSFTFEWYLGTSWTQSSSEAKINCSSSSLQTGCE